MKAMIRYDLKCADGHVFEAWFASSAAFDEQAERGLIACAVCGSSKVEKSLMAPRVPKKGNAKDEKAEEPMMSAPVPKEIADKLAALRKEVEANSDYVGKDFASEARKIHLGESEARSIWGEASKEDAKSLAEDGVPVAPLPFMPKRDA